MQCYTVALHKRLVSAPVHARFTCDCGKNVPIVVTVVLLQYHKLHTSSFFIQSTE